MSKKHHYRTERTDLEVEDETDMIEEIEEDVVDETPVVEEVEDEVVDEPVDDKPIIRGVVVDCSRLNVRETPALDGVILTQIARSTEVIIEEDESTDEFYKVCLATGLEGYCVKQFVKMEN